MSGPAVWAPCGRGALQVVAAKKDKRAAERKAQAKAETKARQPKADEDDEEVGLAG